MSTEMPQQELRGELQRVVEAIVRDSDPLEVILFGSQARGEAGSRSDLDLLVVMPDGTHRRDAAGRMYRALAHVPGRTRAVDIVVTTPTIKDRDRDLDWTVVGTADGASISLYRRPTTAHA